MGPPTQWCTWSLVTQVRTYTTQMALQTRTNISGSYRGLKILHNTNDIDKLAFFDRERSFDRVEFGRKWCLLAIARHVQGFVQMALATAPTFFGNVSASHKSTTAQTEKHKAAETERIHFFLFGNSIDIESAASNEWYIFQKTRSARARLRKTRR